jgi:DNA-binding IclR family transcriptional regulator
MPPVPAKRINAAPTSAEAVLARNVGDAAFATTLAKGLVVLEAFGTGQTSLGNLDISSRTGIPRPTVARLTYTLAELGYLRYDAQKARYSPSGRVLRLVRPLLADMKFRQTARPLMQELAESVRGTVSIGILDGASAIYVESARSGDVGSHVPDIGLPISVVSTAMGRALASLLPPDRATHLEQAIRADSAQSWSEFRTKFRAGIEQCAERGFCTCVGEYIETIHAVAAPLFLAPDLDQPFAINCGIPAFRLLPGQLEAEIGPRLRALATSIRSVVGVTEPIRTRPKQA